MVTAEEELDSNGCACLCAAIRFSAAKGGIQVVPRPPSQTAVPLRSANPHLYGREAGRAGQLDRLD